MPNRRPVRLLVRSALCVLCLFVSAPAFAQVVAPETTHVEISANFWKPTQDLTIEDVRFDEPLAIPDEWFTELRLMLRPGRKHKIRFSYVPMRYAEDGKLVETSIVFNGQTYNVNVPVNYEFKWEMYRFGYEWDALSFSHGYIGLVTEVRYNRVTASLVSPLASGRTVAEVPLPTIGGIARGYLGNYFSITGELSGLDVHFDDKRGKLYDFDVFGQLNFTKSVAAQAGYRRLHTEYRWSGDQGDLLFEGLYFGGTVRF